VGLELVRVELAQSVGCEPSRIVYQQPNRRKTFSGREDRIRARQIAKLSDRLHGSAWNLVFRVVNVSDDIPAVCHQLGGNDEANALACPGYDRCARLILHQRSVVIARAPKQ
jgi:hypothetical protein